MVGPLLADPSQAISNTRQNLAINLVYDRNKLDILSKKSHVRKGCQRFSLWLYHPLDYKWCGIRTSYLMMMVMMMMMRTPTSKTKITKTTTTN